MDLPTIQLFVTEKSTFRTVQAVNPLREYVRIHYDWRLARVVDEAGHVVDERVCILLGRETGTQMMNLLGFLGFFEPWVRIRNFLPKNAKKSLG